MFPIITERLTLRQFESTDTDGLYEFHKRPDVVKYLYWDARSRQDMEKVVAERVSMIALREDGDRIVLAVVLSETNTLIGEVSLALRSREHQQGEIGFVFNPSFHGRGYATESARAVLKLGFEEFAFHRLFGRCEVRNSASWRLMERLGMRREAHFIHNEIFKGEWGEEFVYAILRDEWGGVD